MSRVRLVAGVLAVALVAALALFWPGSERHVATAHFSRAVGLYPGSQVRILGIDVGEVLSVQPQGTSVKVVLEYDAKYPVPADARAAVISPSLVSDRFVQLLPVYTGGPTLADGADIPLERTAVPVELDRIYRSLDDLNVALGPDGANSDGALTRVLATGAANLGGQGENLHGTIADLSRALDTVAGSDDDLFTTVRNLQTFTSTLAASDAQVRQLNTDLAEVSGQLAGERDDLALALSNLAVALDEVSTFVRDNREVLGNDVAALEEVTGVLVDQQRALAETLTNAPVVLSNLSDAYNPRSGTLDTRDKLDASALLCSTFYLTDTAPALASAGLDSAAACGQVSDLLDKLAALPMRLPGLPGAPAGGAP